MADQTNPRKLYRTGSSAVLSLPPEWRREHGFELGDQFVLEATANGFEATKVTYEVANDD